MLQFRLPTRGERARVLAEITPSSDLLAYSTELITGETELFGRLERVGGSTPKAVLRMSERVAVHCDVSEDIARDLGHRLYSWVGVGGQAKWSPFDHSIEGFRIERILPYEDGPVIDAVSRLRELIGGYWDGVDVNAELDALRRGEDE